MAHDTGGGDKRDGCFFSDGGGDEDGIESGGGADGDDDQMVGERSLVRIQGLWERSDDTYPSFITYRTREVGP